MFLQELRPLLQVLILPPVPWLLLILAGAALMRRSRRWAWVLLLGACTLIWLSCTEAAAYRLQGLLLGHTEALSAKTRESLRGQADTLILVLGGGARQRVAEYQDARPSGTTLERLHYGLWLARQTGLPLGFTGGLGRGAQPGDRSEAEIVQHWLQTSGQQARLSLVDAAARDTRDNARLSVALMRERGYQRLLLVTHSQHMQRATRAFARAGWPATQILAAPVGARDVTQPWALLDWLPSPEGFRQNRYVIYEWVGGLAGH